MSSVTVNLVFFAKSRELVGKKTDLLSVPSSTSITDLRRLLIATYPSLEAIVDSFVIAHNQEYLSPEGPQEIAVAEGDELAITMDHIKIQEEVLHVEELVKLVTSPTSGGISVFIGTTRDNFENKKVVQLEYEAYTPMAEQEMKKICTSIRSKWTDVEHICIYHRLGIVPICEASVIIAISSPHRKDAIQAVEFAIDTLKATVPIWKKEIYAEGEPEWKENKECPWKSSS